VVRRRIHLFISSCGGKGGVGKSVASVLSQYFISKGAGLHAVDADPVNHTLGEYRAINVERLSLLKNGNVDRRKAAALWNDS